MARPYEAIFLLGLASAASGVALRVVEPMLPQLAREFGTSVPGAASAITAYAAAYAIGQLVYGPLGDRFGKLRVVSLSILASGVASCACALAQDLASLAALRFATALFAASSVTLGIAYVGDTIPLGERQRIIARFVTGTIVGQAFGPVLGGMVTEMLGWRGAFVVLGVLLGAAGLLLVVRTRDVWAGSGQPAQANPFTVHLRLAAIPRVRVVVGVAFLDAFFFFGAYAFLGAYLSHRFDLPLSLIGAILAGFGVGGLIYAFSVDRLLRALGQGGMALWGGALCCLCFAALVLAPSWMPAFACTTGLGFAFYMLHNTVQIRATEMAPQARGAAVSMYASAWSLAQGAGVAVMGVAVGAIGYVAPVIAYGVGFLALGAWMRANLARL